MGLSTGGNSSKTHEQRADVETASDAYAARFSGPVGRYLLQVQEETTLSLLTPWSRSRVLDVGGGHAQLAAPLVRQGFEVSVVGSDASCRRRLDRLLGAGTFHFQTCDLLDLPFAAKSFDVVLAFRLLAHEPDWVVLLAELCRVAKNAVVVDYPDLCSFNILYGTLFALKQKVEGNTREFATFSRRKISREFRRNGFTELELRPEFLLPMVLHRAMRSAPLSGFVEGVARTLGVTRVFGSPVIVLARRPDAKEQEEPSGKATSTDAEPGRG